MTVYVYGMRLRGYSPGAQPKGVLERRDDYSGMYYDLIVYDHPLTDDECRMYDLDRVYNPKTAQELSAVYALGNTNDFVWTGQAAEKSYELSKKKDVLLSSYQHYKSCGFDPDGEYECELK